MQGVRVSVSHVMGRNNDLAGVRNYVSQAALFSRIQFFLPSLGKLFSLTHGQALFL
jgi:hypothetical protein